jgi:O-antigen/teichoic acid export membrane protein
LAILGNYLFIRFGILILGHYNYIEEIATYELINKIFMILLLPFSLLGQVVAPNFAILSAKKENKRIYDKSIKYTIIFLIIGLVLGLIFYFILPFAFKIFFLNYFTKPYFKITFLLSLVIFVTNVWAATFDAGILIPTGHAKLMAKFYIAIGILGSILSLVLVNYIGFIGVILSMAISSFIMVVGLRTLYFRNLIGVKDQVSKILFIS